MREASANMLTVTRFRGEHLRRPYVTLLRRLAPLVSDLLVDAVHPRARPVRLRPF